MHQVPKMRLCSVMHQVPKMLHSLRQVHMILLLQCYFFSFVSVRIVLYSAAHKCHNSMYANMMLIYFNVFHCSVLFVSQMLLNGMYYTSTLCRCQKDGMYVDMTFSCLNVFQYAVLFLLELSCIQCVSGPRCF